MFKRGTEIIIIFLNSSTREFIYVGFSLKCISRNFDYKMIMSFPANLYSRFKSDKDSLLTLTLSLILA